MGEDGEPVHGVERLPAQLALELHAQVVAVAVRSLVLVRVLRHARTVRTRHVLALLPRRRLLVRLHLPAAAAAISARAAAAARGGAAALVRGAGAPSLRAGRATRGASASSARAAAAIVHRAAPLSWVPKYV